MGMGVSKAWQYYSGIVFEQHVFSWLAQELIDMFLQRLKILAVMKLKTIEFACIMLTALVMGVFWGTWFTLTRSIPDFSAAEFIHIGKTIIANVTVPMAIIMPATLLCMLTAILLSRRINRKAFYLYSVAFLLMVITLIITVGVEVPIDNQIKTWTATTIPSNWELLRQRWDHYHTLRTFTSIGSLGFFAWGVIKRLGHTS